MGVEPGTPDLFATTSQDCRCPSLYPAETWFFVWCFLCLVVFDPQIHQEHGSGFNPRLMIDSPGLWMGEVITLGCY